VFEGNGGDLRIGLPMQSIHDGQVLRHTPLRLSVFIEAPVESINTIVSKHSFVKEFLDHAWLFCFTSIQRMELLVAIKKGSGWHYALLPKTMQFLECILNFELT
jgi:uncharacterized protein